jgi:hypothetical protein
MQRKSSFSQYMKSYFFLMHPFFAGYDYDSSLPADQPQTNTAAAPAASPPLPLPSDPKERAAPAAPSPAAAAAAAAATIAAKFSPPSGTPSAQMKGPSKPAVAQPAAPPNNGKTAGPPSTAGSPPAAPSVQPTIASITAATAGEGGPLTTQQAQQAAQQAQQQAQQALLAQQTLLAQQAAQQAQQDNAQRSLLQEQQRLAVHKLQQQTIIEHSQVWADCCVLTWGADAGDCRILVSTIAETLLELQMKLVQLCCKCSARFTCTLARVGQNSTSYMYGVCTIFLAGISS